MHAAALRGFTRNLEAIPYEQLHSPDGYRVLDMGGQDVNGTVHEALFSRLGYTPPAVRLDVLDIEAGAGVTIVGDARSLGWWEQMNPPALYDLVISTEMMEHLAHWHSAVKVTARVLRSGGWFVGTCASMGRGAHGATGAPSPAPGEHYENVTPDALISSLDLAGFDPVEVQYSYDTSEPHGAGDLYWRARKAS